MKASDPTDFDKLPDTAGVPLPVVRALYGNPSPSTIWRWSKKGFIPHPYKAGPNRTLWNVGELRESIAASHRQRTSNSTQVTAKEVSK